MPEQESGQPPDAEVVDGQADELPTDSPPAQAAAQPTSSALAVRGGSTELIAAENAAAKVEVAKEIATQLDAIIRQQGLRTKMGNRKRVVEVENEDGSKGTRDKWEPSWHVNVEGWQTLATFLGLAVVPQEPTLLFDPSTGRPAKTEYEVERTFYVRGTKGADIKSGKAEVDRVERATVSGYDWRCRAEVFKDGTLMSAADAICSRSEENWRDRPDHALQSMAQTRAIGKAIAGAARWIVTLADYSATPAEEMPAEAARERADAQAQESSGEPERVEVERPDAELAQRAFNALVYLVRDDPTSDEGKDAAVKLAQGVWGEVRDTAPGVTTDVVRTWLTTAQRLRNSRPPSPTDTGGTDGEQHEQPPEADASDGAAAGDGGSDAGGDAA